MNANGWNKTKAGITNKLARGAFTATLFLTSAGRDWMPNGSIGGLVVIALIALLFLFLVLDWPKYARYKARSADDTYWDRIGGEPYGTSFYASDRVIDRHEYQHREKEQRYWDASIALSTFTILIALVGAIFAGFAFVATRDQADIARRAFVENDRPVIDVTFIEQIVFGPDSKPKIKFGFANVGNKPGYMRALVGVVKVGSDTIGKCNAVFGSFFVETGKQMELPCFTQALSATQMKTIKDKSSRFSISGSLYYRSLTGYCWEQRFSYFWVDTAPVMPAHLVADKSEAANDEVAIECSTASRLSAD